MEIEKVPGTHWGHGKCVVPFRSHPNELTKKTSFRADPNLSVSGIHPFPLSETLARGIRMEQVQAQVTAYLLVPTSLPIHGYLNKEGVL